jgi:cellobiose dehydrogenase (acceptor)
MVAATNRVFSIIPGTDHPSTDHQLYLLQDGFNIVKQGLQNKGWVNVTANAVGASKNNSFSYTNYMSQYGERGGPMATYLVTANKSANFHLWLNTSVERINRINGHATSLNVIPTNNGGYEGTVNLTPITGRVILAAGTFGDSKLLFRSGIGPTDMLTVVNASTDGPTMINSSYWINLPVGYNLADHLNTDTVITHPNITYYNWPDAWDTPIAADATAYLTHRTGPLTQAAPNIGPMMWDEVVGPDGILRQFQWTSRVEGSNGVPSGNAMTMSLYLGRGQVSRGRTTIEEGLNMVVSTLPWGDANDLATVAIEIDRMRAAMATVPGLTQQLPMNNQTSVEYVASVLAIHAYLF